jgi:hypothetical protein
MGLIERSPMDLGKFGPALLAELQYQAGVVLILSLLE